MLPCLDIYAYSYRLAMLKPEPQMHQWGSEQFGVTPGGGFGSGDAVHMIGDSIRCDRDGPRVVVIMGHHLERRGSGHITSLLQLAQMVVESNSH